ncbi:DUF1294 domain-containing protein [Rhizobium sp. CG5]|uniref:DUF1294 domain-containing protein n=1 Tax=Rhizobium sp. CG5 TaxID=2726076 RepID=UPI002033D876|nr:DUF1294 domain-containing protein [Rhizobium sp. CG5]MCM2473781.1 DUF1294 domain-containing protein [Rhizobium sp. CG5]
MALEHILYLALIVALYNAVVFCVYWWDKMAARDGGWRIRESTLLTLALLAGSPGALLACNILRHKTRKQPFATYLIGIAGIHVLIIAAAGIILAVAPSLMTDMARGVMAEFQ